MRPLSDHRPRFQIRLNACRAPGLNLYSAMIPTSFEKSKIKFLLLEAVHKSALATLTKAGYENVEYLTTSLEEEELKEKISN